MSTGVAILAAVACFVGAIVFCQWLVAGEFTE
jgi:hypothetical protein